MGRYLNPWQCGICFNFWSIYIGKQHGFVWLLGRRSEWIAYVMYNHLRMRKAGSVALHLNQITITWTRTRSVLKVFILKLLRVDKLKKF